MEHAQDCSGKRILGIAFWKVEGRLVYTLPVSSALQSRVNDPERSGMGESVCNPST